MITSSTKTGGDTVTAANNNAQRLDDLQMAGEYLADVGAANAYDVTCDAQITSLVAGQVVKFMVANANTGASTLRFQNGVALDETDSIKRVDGSSLIGGDLKAGQLVTCCFDGTDWIMTSPRGIIVDSFFHGDGSDGVLDTSSAPVSIDLGGLEVVVKNYTLINIASNNLTFTNAHANGTIIIFKCIGNVTISATIDASGIGGGGGTGGAPSFGDGTDGKNPTGFLIGDTSYDIFGAGGDGDGGGGISGGTRALLRSFYANEKSNAVYVMCGAGGGGGEAGGGANGGVGGAGGAGGGALAIFCAGAWNFTGTINVKGTDGTIGGNSPTPGVDGGGGGGGAGGAGGMLYVLYGSLTASSGTIQINGGDGGDGGIGAADGGGSFLHGGSGGGGAGGYAGTGGTGGGGASGTIVGAGGAGGTGNGSAGSGSSGGGLYFSGGGGGGGAGGYSNIKQGAWYI